jgi:predicted HD phosphohydrolase
MTDKAAAVIRRAMYRIAMAYGDATSVTMREKCDPRAPAAANRAWQQGCYLGWKQLQILFDTGNVVHNLEEATPNAKTTESPRRPAVEVDRARKLAGVRSRL